MINSPNRRPVWRALRVVAASICGLVCWLSIVLWVRNFWRDDHVYVGAVGGGTSAASISRAGVFLCGAPA